MNEVIKEWENEPDAYDGVFKDYKYQITRNSHSKSLRGYVKIPETHKLYGIEYTDYCWEWELTVHGGITYSGNVKFDDGWYVGFDCAHLCDYCPGYESQFHDETAIYRNLQYVINNCEYLISQIIDLEIKQCTIPEEDLK